MKKKILNNKYSNPYPSTRYMGSKNKLLPAINDIVNSLDVSSAFDVFSGTGCVAYQFKKIGLKVSTNDFLKFSYHFTHASIENNKEKLTDKDVSMLLAKNRDRQSFIEDTFKNLYFTDEDNRFMDNLWVNIQLLDNEYKKSLAFSALFRACLKRRPRGVFAYTGNKYDDGRKDLKKDLKQHFSEAVAEWNNTVFDNGKSNKAYNSDIFKLDIGHHDLVYLDPPYFSLKSDNDYTRRYHFLEGFASYWKDDEIDYDTKTKKIKSKITPFSTKTGVYKAFDTLFQRFRDSIILVSYYSNGLPSKEELIEMLHKYKRKVDTIDITQTYSFGTHGHKIGNANNRITEYLFIAK